MIPAALYSHGTCVFVARHVIGSRPIKLYNLLPRYNKHNCCQEVKSTDLSSGVPDQQSVGSSSGLDTFVLDTLPWVDFTKS